MIKLNLEISKIDYEKTVEKLFPIIMKRILKEETDSLPLRFLQKMENSPRNIIIGILESMPQKRKNELLCELATVYNFELKDALGNFLNKTPVGGYISIGSIYAVNKNGGVGVVAEGVDIDYKSLICDDTVNQFIEGKLKNIQKLLRGALLGLLEDMMSADKDKLEKRIIFLAGISLIKNGLLSMLRSIISDAGVCIELDDFDITQDSRIRPLLTTGEKKLSYALEEELLNAAAGYLRPRFEEKNH